MSVQLAQYRGLYFSEAREQLATIAASLRKLEGAPAERNAFEAALRATHTLKGMSATMGYDEVTVFAHAFEDLLESIRERSDGGPSSAEIYPLVRTLDHLNSIVSRLESGESPEADLHPGEAISVSSGSERAPGDISSLVRVSFEQLERLMARTVDVVVSANRLAHKEGITEQVGGGDRWREHLSLVKQLRAAAWSLQMAPVGDAFDRFPRMLHDLARAQRKEIRIAMEGREIEVGRTVLDEIGEALLHLLRNAVAHGIEPMAERLMSGKDPRGTVLIRAGQVDGSITIEVSDDGRGLDAQRILQAAYEQGLISEAERRTLDEAEAYNLIMRSGFSLSPVVTQASGRGVGMDIVRNRVQALRGTMHIHSRAGLGTAFIMNFPCTFGAVQVELVRVADQIVAIPAAQIDSRMALTRDDLTRLRPGEIVVSDRILRLLDLRSLFRVPPRSASDSYGLLVINNRAGTALRVDELLGKALLGKLPAGDVPAVPLLDLVQLPPP